MRRTWIGILILLVGLALLPVSLRAQLPKQRKLGPGEVAGEVVNAQGAPVAGAQIVWQTADGGKPHALHCDAHGHFRIASLPSGLYELRASKGSASSDWVHNLLVKPGTGTSVTLHLTLIAPPKVASHR
jgi:hypothetical protein